MTQGKRSPDINTPTYSVEFRGGPQDHAPRITVTADTETEFELRLEQLEHNTTLATIGRLSHALEAQYNLGRILGATGTTAPANADVPEEPASEEPEPPAPTKKPKWAARPAEEEPPFLAGLNLPAKKIHSKDPNSNRTAWTDPRPADVTRSITVKTSDPNDPRLATGEAKFFAVIGD